MQNELQLAENQSLLSGADTIATSNSNSNSAQQLQQPRGANDATEYTGEVSSKASLITHHRKLAGDGTVIRNGDIVLLETEGM